MKKWLILSIVALLIIVAGVFAYLYYQGNFVNDGITKIQKCKVYASCCLNGYTCAESPLKCDLTQNSLCQKGNPSNLTRAYCVYRGVSDKYYNGPGCYPGYLHGGANCKEYCDYWKSQGCKSTFSEEMLKGGWDPFDLQKWQKNCPNTSCECIVNTNK